MRVVSLLPSATELLCELGGEHLLVGRSHECDYPATISDLPVLTRQRTCAVTSAQIDREVRQALADETVDSLYALDGNLLSSLAPDVILTQDLCDVCSIDLNTVQRLAQCMEPKPRIVSLNPSTIEDVFDDLLRVGEAVGRTNEAQAARAALRSRYRSALDQVDLERTRPEVAFLEWMDPLFVAGHWTPELIEAADGQHSLNKAGQKSRRIEPERLVASRPDRLIICPCGYDLAAIKRELPILTQKKWWKGLPAVIERQVVMVDGNLMFNRPGPRLVDAQCWLVGWLGDRAEVIPSGFPAERVV